MFNVVQSKRAGSLCPVRPVIVQRGSCHDLSTLRPGPPGRISWAQHLRAKVPTTKAPRRWHPSASLAFRRRQCHIQQMRRSRLSLVGAAAAPRRHVTERSILRAISVRVAAAQPRQLPRRDGLPPPFAKSDPPALAAVSRRRLCHHRFHRDAFAMRTQIVTAYRAIAAMSTTFSGDGRHVLYGCCSAGRLTRVPDRRPDLSRFSVQTRFVFRPIRE